MTKEEKLINSIIELADDQLGGVRSRKAKELFSDIAGISRDLGYVVFTRIMQRVADHYIYD